MRKTFAIWVLLCMVGLFGCAVNESYVNSHKNMDAKELDVLVGTRLPRMTVEKLVKTTDGTTFNQDTQIRGIANEVAKPSN